MHHNKKYSQVKPRRGSRPFFPPTIQRSPIDPDGGEHDFKLRTPSLSEGFRKPTGYSFNLPPLSIDPEVQAQMEVFRMLNHSLSFPNLQLGASLLKNPNLGIGSTNLNPSLSFRHQFLNLPMQTAPPMKFNLPKPQPPLVPAGKGSEKPREGKLSDLAKAFIKIPAVETKLDEMKKEAFSVVSDQWDNISKTGKGGIITSAVVLGVGGVSGLSLMSSDQRRPLLKAIIGMKIPIPKTPLSFQYSQTDNNETIILYLNVGQILLKKWGFK